MQTSKPDAFSIFIPLNGKKKCKLKFNFFENYITIYLKALSIFNNHFIVFKIIFKRDYFFLFIFIAYRRLRLAKDKYVRP